MYTLLFVVCKFLWGKNSKHLRDRKQVWQQQYKEIRKADSILESLKCCSFSVLQMLVIQGHRQHSPVLWGMDFSQTTQFYLLLPGTILGPRDRDIKKIRHGPLFSWSLAPRKELVVTWFWGGWFRSRPNFGIGPQEEKWFLGIQLCTDEFISLRQSVGEDLECGILLNRSFTRSPCKAQVLPSAQMLYVILWGSFSQQTRQGINDDWQPYFPDNEMSPFSSISTNHQHGVMEKKILETLTRPGL